MSRSRVLAATFFLIPALLLGCAGSSPTHYYTLNAASANDFSKGDIFSCAIAVGTITIPEVVDRPQIVVQTAPNRVALLEQHRWAEPLKSEISRAVIAGLGRQFTNAWITDFHQPSSRGADYRISIDIQRFESQLNDAAVIEALWVVRRTSTGEEAKGKSAIREPVSGNSYEELAAAHGRALQVMAGEMAGIIRTLAGKDKKAPCVSGSSTK